MTSQEQCLFKSPLHICFNKYLLSAWMNKVYNCAQAYHLCEASLIFKETKKYVTFTVLFILIYVTYNTNLEIHDL